MDTTIVLRRYVKGDNVGLAEYALIEAMRHDHLDLIKYILASGANINIRDSDNKSLLWIAAENCHRYGYGLRNISYYTTLKFLIPLLDINVRDGYNHNDTILLHMCQDRKCIDTCIILVESGIDVNVKDTMRKCTALFYAVGRSDAIKLVISLISAGADINPGKDNNYKMTILELANSGGAETDEKRKIIVDEYVKYILKIKMLLKYLGLENIYYVLRQILEDNLTDTFIKEIVYGS